LKTKNI